MSNPSYIQTHTLNEAWFEACKFVYTNGKDIKTDIKQKEVTNLHIIIENGFETEHDLYFKYFSKDSYNQVMRVYSKAGDKELQKNYWERIYNNQGIDQVSRVESILKTDPLSKSATIVLADITKEKQSCVLDINFRIRNEMVDMTIIFKSSDIAKKFIPDIVVLTRIHEKISRELNLARGSVEAFILSAQIHEADYKTVKKLTSQKLLEHYYDTNKAIDNWNGDAEEWEEKLKNPDHYVNIENGYNRFIDFANKITKEHVTKNQVVLDSGCGTVLI
jgi:thymidylate synthase